MTTAKKVESIAVRLPADLRTALEKERQRVSKKAGAEVQTSSVIRAILERALLPKRSAA